MTRPVVFLASPLIFLALAACEPMPTTGTTGSTVSARPVNLPESVVSIAAPNQDLASARIRSDDGCYWYTHRGPVETTQLPLRTVNGNPICTRPSG